MEEPLLKVETDLLGKLGDPEARPALERLLDDPNPDVDQVNTIEAARHYPFAYSDNPILKWINKQMILAKPAFHEKTFLKPLQLCVRELGIAENRVRRVGVETNLPLFSLVA